MVDACEDHKRYLYASSVSEFSHVPGSDRAWLRPSLQLFVL